MPVEKSTGFFYGNAVFMSKIINEGGGPGLLAVRTFSDDLARIKHSSCQEYFFGV